MKGLLIAFPLVLLLVSIQDRVKMLKEPIGIGLIVFATKGFKIKRSAISLNVLLLIGLGIELLIM